MQLSHMPRLGSLWTVVLTLSHGYKCSAAVVVASSLRGAPAANSSGVNSSNTSAPARARLDVGFASFEKDVMSEMSRSIEGRLTSGGWDVELRTALITDMAATLHDALSTELKPMKQSIAKTWMALPEDKQKDEYVEKLRASFSSMFSSTVERVGSHANMSLDRLAAMGKTQKTQLGREELLKQGLSALNSSVLADHCYDEPKSFKQKQKAESSVKEVAKQPANKAGEKQVSKAAALKPVIAALQAQEDPVGQFCVKSLLHGFVHRLDDAQNLVSMTMRFDAHALAMMQQTKVQVA